MNHLFWGWPAWRFQQHVEKDNWREEVIDHLPLLNSSVVSSQSLFWSMTRDRPGRASTEGKRKRLWTRLGKKAIENGRAKVGIRNQNLEATNSLAICSFLHDGKPYWKIHLYILSIKASILGCTPCLVGRNPGGGGYSHKVRIGVCRAGF